jgi:hypothetical protein
LWVCHLPLPEFKLSTKAHYAQHDQTLALTIHISCLKIMQHTVSGLVLELYADASQRSLVPIMKKFSKMCLKLTIRWIIFRAKETLALRNFEVLKKNNSKTFFHPGHPFLPSAL